MTPETVMTIGTRALEITLMLAAPLLLVALVTGLLVGVFQESGSPIQSYAVTPGRIERGPMAARLRSAAAARSARR